MNKLIFPFKNKTFYLVSMDWFNYDSDNRLLCKIHTFDDGIEDIYENQWLIIATNNRGKYRIQNIKNTEINYSISCWKVEIIS